MAATKRPGNPWNMFSKKKQPPTAIKKRTPGASVKVERNRALPPGKPGGPLVSGGARPRKPDPQKALTGRPQQRALPGGTGGADTVRGSGTRTGQPGAARRALPPAKPSAPKPSTSVPKPSPRAAVPRGTMAAGLIGELAGNLLDPVARKAGEAIGRNVLRPAGQALDRATGGSRRERQIAQDAINRRKAQATVDRLGQYAKDGRYIPGSAQVPFNKPAAPKLPPPASRPSSGGGSTTGGRSTSIPRAAQLKASPTPAGKKPASGGSYGADGKQLYNADKKDNPLMQRTFGYQTGGAPDQKKEQADRAKTVEFKPGAFTAKEETTIAPLKSDYKLPEKAAKGARREFNPLKRRSPYTR